MRALGTIAILAIATAMLGGCVAMGKRCKFDGDCPSRLCVKSPGSSHGNCVWRKDRWQRRASLDERSAGGAEKVGLLSPSILALEALEPDRHQRRPAAPHLVHAAGQRGFEPGGVADGLAVVADAAGCHAIVLDAIPDGGEAEFARRKGWYESFGFATFASDPARMFLAMKQVRAAVRARLGHAVRSLR